MSIMDWSDRLDIKVPSMNAEHREILRLMNRLHDLNEAGASKGDLISAVVALGAYTVKHFSDEEAYMRSIKYPDLEKHRLIHKDLLEKFDSHKNKFIVGGGKVEPEFFEFLKLWLSAHIQGIDKKYGAFAGNSGGT